jgi:predicted transcriptional regulator
MVQCEAEPKMKVKDMMHRASNTLRPTTRAIARRMREPDVGAIPVASDCKLVGVITDRDIAIRCAADDETMSKVKAKNVMTAGVVYCRDNEDVGDAVRIMEGKQVRRLPVLDEAMRMVGMVSLGDVSHALPRDIAGEVAKAVSAHHP